MKPGKNMLAVILFIITASVLVAIFGVGDDIKGIREMRYGIDIRGGVEAIFEADGITEIPTKQELETAREVLELRLDAANITDREVTVDQEGGYIIVRFPWKSDETSFKPEDAIAELGEMAKLTFRDPKGNILVDGKNVTGSTVEKEYATTGNGYVVSLNFDSEGAKKFEMATENLLGQHIGIYMDDEQISNPLVETKISGKNAIISGMESYDAAKSLSDKINAGALPFSLKTTSFSTISPTMGNRALEVMITAGCLAFFVVCLFMFFYYKLPGAVACLTLLLQMTLQLLVLSIPQYTLTLPGIAGIILSLGMAVDANIIISERISEELQKGYSVRAAIRNGYKNGFTSVLDGNITTAVVAVILMIFGSGSMLSFGYTLLAGMLVNLIAGVTVSKQILLSISLYKKWNNERWFRQKKELRIRKFFKKKWICLLLSGIIFVVGIIGCVRKGVPLDIQFTGGVVLSYTVDGTSDITAIETEVGQATDRVVTVRETKSNVSEERNLQITLAGNDGITPKEQKEITLALERAEGDGQIKLAQTYAVEPYIGERSLKNATIAIGLSFLFIVIYVAFRFSSLSGFAAGVTALLALFHDVFVVFFVFVLAGIPLNDAFVAVVLTIIGYSINDTIVVYDRIRENQKDCPKMDIVELNDLSVSQIFSRSVNTSLTTAVCVFIILVASIVFQITSIWAFALPMLFGLISGCYSSICIAGLLWAIWKKRFFK